MSPEVIPGVIDFTFQADQAFQKFAAAEMNLADFIAFFPKVQLAASINLEKVIASLDEAKPNYQKQQYEYSLKVSDYQTLMQKQQEQINSLQTLLDKVDEELEQLTNVYSPYRGNIRRVKILGQNERSITAEVTLDIRSE